MVDCLVPPLPAPPLLRAQVIFSWKGSKDNHLPIQRGEIVSVLQQSEKWWSGEFNGKVTGALFPMWHVKHRSLDLSLLYG